MRKHALGTKSVCRFSANWVTAQVSPGFLTIKVTFCVTRAICRLRSLYEQSLASFRELNDRWGIAGSLADLGNLVREQGDLQHPMGCITRA